MKKIFKCKNLFLVTFLAIAGFFSATAIVVNKQVEETPVVEKADAFSSGVKCGSTFYLDTRRFAAWGTTDSNSEWLHMYFFNSNSDNNWADPVRANAGSNGVYTFTVPSSGSGSSFFRYCIALRRGDSTKTFDNRHNQTNDIDLNSSALHYNSIQITGWGNGDPTKLKTIDVDLSKNTKFISSGSSPGLRYRINNSNFDVSLIHIGDNVFQTTQQIPVMALNNSGDGYGYHLYCFGQQGKDNDCTSVWTRNCSLKYDNYDHILLGGYKANEHANVTAYGCYNVKIDNPSPTPNTHRIWLINNNSFFYGNDEWGYRCNNALGYEDSNGDWHHIQMPSVSNAQTGQAYFYADIPTNVTSIHFLRLSGTPYHDHTYYQDAYISSVQYGACYCAGTDSYEAFTTINPQVINNADNVVLAKILEAYYTCKSNEINGCATATINRLKSTWFDNKHSSADLTATLNDYADYDTSYTGSRTKTVTIAYKWLAMNTTSVPFAKTTISNFTLLGNNDDSSYIIIIIIASSISILSITALSVLMVKKRKSKEQ